MGLWVSMVAVRLYVLIFNKERVTYDYFQSPRDLIVPDELKTNI